MAEKEKIKSFEDLECWKACVEVRIYITVLIKNFPPFEKFDLVSNLRRASRSSTRNIAEGYGRYHFQENIQFCRQARGSLFELIDDLITARDEGYITNEEFNKAKGKIEIALRLLNGYINYLERAKRQQLTNNK